MREGNESPKILLEDELISKLSPLFIEYKYKYRDNKIHLVLAVTTLVDNTTPTSETGKVVKAVGMTFGLVIDIVTIPVIPLKAVGYWFFGHSNRARMQPIEKIITILTKTKTLVNKENNIGWQKACLEYVKQRNLIINTPSMNNQSNNTYSRLMEVLAETDDYFSFRLWLTQQIIQFINTFPRPIVDIFIDFLYGERKKASISYLHSPKEETDYKVGVEVELKEEKERLNLSLASSSFLTESKKTKLGLLEGLGFNKQEFLAEFKQIEVDFKSSDSACKTALKEIYGEIKKVFWDINQLTHISETTKEQLFSLKVKIKEKQTLLLGESLSNEIVNKWYDKLGQISKHIDDLIRAVLAENSPGYY